jgi:signal peptidase I
MSVLIFLIVLYLLNTFTLQKVFAKAGVDSKKALIPGVAAGAWSDLIGKSRASTWWLLFPIVNFFTYAGMCIDLVRSFGMHGFWDSVLAVVASPLQFWRIGNQDQYKYEGPILVAENEWKTKMLAAEKGNDKIGMEKLRKDTRFAKSPMRDWTEAIVFAVFAAAFIRMFLIEAYVIPTPSMEGSLNVGDYLFVSKAHYGIRTPKTVVQFPLIFNHLGTGESGFSKLLNRESYIETPSLTPVRLPALESIDRNEPVVFNYPEGDSVYLYPGRTFSIYDLRAMGPEAAQVMRKYPLITRPIDKMDHYIKRCIAVGGDSIQVREGQVYINGQAVENPKKMQHLHSITSTSTPINLKKLEALGIDIESGEKSKNLYAMDEGQIAAVKAWGADVQVTRFIMPPRGNMFPRNEAVSAGWSGDNYGPVWIPKQGATTPLTMENLPIYHRVIDVYEENELEVRGGKIYINGQEATSYTFKHNYYWMMGDNRHNSEDSRFWGYVPSTHVVGKPLFIWFSTKDANIRKGINWDRIFTSAQKF